MALVSPGQQITVTDESQYISNAIGTVPLVIMATAQDKTINTAPPLQVQQKPMQVSYRYLVANVI